MISTTFSVRLTQAERAALKRLAQESGRTPAGVLRRLLALAELPDNRRALGVAGDTKTEYPREVPG